MQQTEGLQKDQSQKGNYEKKGWSLIYLFFFFFGFALLEIFCCFSLDNLFESDSISLLRDSMSFFTRARSFEKIEIDSSVF